MSEVRVVLDPDGLQPVGAKLKEPLEEQLTSAMRVATDQVENDYAGESVEEVTEEIMLHTRAALHPDIAAGFRPDPAAVRQVAAEIVDGNQ